jgi:LacI family transcriptional regulator
MAARRKVAVVMELEWPYKRHYEIFAGIREYAEEHGGWDFEPGNFPQYEIQQGKKFDGIIGRITEDILSAGRKSKIPVVNVKVDTSVLSKVPSVNLDFRLAGRMAAEHLINCGLRRFVSFGFKGSIPSKLHYEGMREVAKEHGCQCKRYVVPSNFSEQERAWKQFFDYTNKAIASWQAPIGVGFSSDELAFAVTTICKSRGWRIPEQMAVIGLNNEVMICNASSPTLSSIDMSDKRCGYEAAQLLDRMMKGEKISNNTIHLIPPKELILRRSSDAYAVEDVALVHALSYMSENSHTKISVTDIAKAAGIGRQTLEHRFRKQLKRTVNDELIRLRVSRMKRLLVETEQTIGEISDQVGFGTTANMHVMFKRQTDMTPIAYREKHNPKLDRDLSK